jgi:hypothetical protein
MSNDAEMTMLLYENLLPGEESVLKPMESVIIQTLLANSITDRPYWTSSSESRARIVQLILPDKTEDRILLNLTPEEVKNISQNDLLARLDNI